MIVPGVAGRETIGHNHALHCTPETFDGVGRPCDASPMRLDLEEAASRLRPPLFIVDAVLNGNLEVVRVVAGDPVAAHRDGVRTSRSIFAVPFAGAVDVVLTTSHPMDQDLRQGLKSLANTIRAVRRGGVLIALLRAEEGVGVVGLAQRKRSLPPRVLRLLAPLLVRVVPRMPLRGMGEEDPVLPLLCAAGYAACASPPVRAHDSRRGPAGAPVRAVRRLSRGGARPGAGDRGREGDCRRLPGRRRDVPGGSGVTEPGRDVPAPFRYRALAFTARGLVRVLFRPRVLGREHVPHGGFILCSNHLSGFDLVALAYPLSRRWLRHMAKPQLFAHRLLGPLIRLLGAFPASSGAVERAVDLAREGYPVVIMPEGRAGDRGTCTARARVPRAPRSPPQSRSCRRRFAAPTGRAGSTGGRSPSRRRSGSTTSRARSRIRPPSWRPGGCGARSRRWRRRSPKPIRASCPPPRARARGSRSSRPSSAETPCGRRSLAGTTT